MPERQGSVHARTLYEKQCDKKTRDEWKGLNGSYDDALNRLAKSKKSTTLVSLDEFVHKELPMLISRRSPRHLLHEELTDVMKWKITRGKFRPLLKLAASNSPSSVVEISTLSFSQLEAGDWEAALDTISQLRGVGVATGSAILSFVDPAQCPFMADEVLEATGDGREYNMRAYKAMRSALLQKAEELGSGWTAGQVGDAMWTCAMLNTLPDSAESTSKAAATSSSSPATSGRKRATKAESSVSASATAATAADAEPKPNKKRKLT